MNFSHANLCLRPKVCRLRKGMVINMTLHTQKEADKTTVTIEGRLDTSTAPQLETEFAEIMKDTPKLVLDMADLEYVSSAGLRVLLNAHKQMSKAGGLTIKNANEMVMEVFEVTGFVDIFHIE